MSKKRNRKKLAVLLTMQMLLLCVLLELGLWLFLRFPVLIKYFPPIRPTMIHIYFDRDLDILQYQPACACFNDALFYTLKPGSCTHKAREFETEYHINSKGLRDDEASLNFPEIVMLGDSYGMGWGVRQDETYAQIVERETGKTVLNGAVSSYGTARQFKMLERIDTDSLEVLVIQYCENDFEENKSFVDNGFELDISSQEEYQAAVEHHVNRRKYVPFYYLRSFFHVNIGKRFYANNEAAALNHSTDLPVYKAGLQVKEKESDRETPSQTVEAAEEEARYFLETLQHHAHKLQGVQVIALSLSYFEYETQHFTDALSHLIQSEELPPLIQNVKVIDTETFLERGDYFILDNHLDELGHKKIAASILAELDTQ